MAGIVQFQKTSVKIVNTSGVDLNGQLLANYEQYARPSPRYHVVKTIPYLDEFGLGIIKLKEITKLANSICLQVADCKLINRYVYAFFD